ncbi:MAG: hypothetical protein IKL06_04075 [Lachnospiraceae bacterium]|nr:hypothetical protein [Lachnospiraceae bacterium]
MLRRLNDALPGLVLGIVIYGIVVELVGVWFVEDKLRYSTGLLIGIVVAIGLAINIAQVIRDAVEIYGADGARNRLIIKSVLRYLVVVVVFFVMMKFNLGNLVTAFIGVLGLKVSAYLQPFTHKVILKIQGRGDNSLEEE